jgi:hypothetical protein
MAGSGKIILRGFLIKRKNGGQAKGLTKFMSYNTRWFTMQEVGVCAIKEFLIGHVFKIYISTNKQAADQIELALCYFRLSEDREASGWIYLKDVKELSEGKKGRDAGCILTIYSVARTLTIEATTDEDYLLWLQALVDHCPMAKTDNIRSKRFKHKHIHLLSLYTCSYDHHCNHRYCQHL